MIKNFCCITFFTSILLFTQAQENNYINYTVEDGLPSDMVYCVEQDDRGFMWFGTDSGLSRYDGYEFINYTLADGLPDTEILHFFKDSQSRIWFYTLNGKVGFLKNDSIFSSKNTEWIRSLNFQERITSIVELNNKIFFSAIGNEIKILEETSVKNVKLGIRDYYSLCKCNNEIYLLSQEGIYNFKGDTLLQSKYVKSFREFTYPLCFKDIIYTYDRGHLRNGLITIDNKIINLSIIPIEKRIFNLQVIDNKIHLLTNNGVYRIEKIHPLVLKETISLNGVSSMMLDDEENIWYTSIESGIYFTPRTELKLNISSQNVTALKKIDKKLLIATDKKTISTLDTANTTDLFLEFQTLNTVHFIAKNNLQEIWIGRDDGLFVDGKKKSLSSISISFFDSIAFVGARGGIRKMKYDEKEEMIRIKGYAIDLLAINRDSVLVGTDNGLLVYKLGVLTPFSNNKLLSQRINAIHQLGIDRLVLATSGNGILIYHDNKILQITTDNGLISNIISKIDIEDSTIWALTPKGINRIKLKDGGMSIKSIDKSDGIKTYYINDIELFNKKLFISTNDGLYSLPTSIQLNESNTFKLYIDKVKTENGLNHSAQFSYDIRSIEIIFKALLFAQKSSLKYQYQLVINNETPDEDKWLDTNINKVNFSNLKSGSYRFFVRAKTKNSDWTYPSIYKFRVIPATWQTSWFKFLVILTLMSILSGYVYRQSKRRLIRKNLEKAKVSAELTALKAQINPHFLFNVLNSIQSFILENEKEIAQEYLVKYGKLMRMVLDDSDHLIVPLESEIKMLSLYTDLEKLRLKNGFDFEVIVSNYFDSRRILIPSMVIQPFIENAIWHGLSPLKEKGKVTLKVSHQQDHIQIQIIDNGIGFDQNSKKLNGHTSSGVRLVRERLNLTQNSKLFKSELEVKSELGKGTSITILFSDSLTDENI